MSSTKRQEVRGRAGARYYPVPGHINYGVTNLGDVIRFDTTERVDWDVEDDQNIFVRLDDERLPIQNVLAAALMGPLNVPIVTGQKVYDGGRVRYVILPAFLRFEPPNIVFVRDIEFRVVPKTEGRIYVSADNVFTLSRFSGMDPEVRLDADTYHHAGMYSQNYPIPMTLTMGIDVKF